MTIRSMKWAGGVSLAAAVLALGTALPVGSASAQVTAVPREGIAFNDQITQRVLSKVKPGSIVLFHNAAIHTPEALPGILESLQKEGYKIVPISQLIYKENYTIDHAGKQHSLSLSGSSETDSKYTASQG